MNKLVVQRKINSKLGPLSLVATEDGLLGVYWDNQVIADSNFHTKKNAAFEILDLTEMQLYEYFNGERKYFDLPLVPDGTEFQKQVWDCLTQIPYGTTKSYKDIAKELKNHRACRAVGSANGKNPLCIIVPCHRVISSDGTLGGYSGGLHLKKSLLEIERIQK